MSAPGDVLRAGGDLLTRNTEMMAFSSRCRLPTTVDNMPPGNPFIQSFSQIPTAPGIAAHSVTSVKGDGPPDNGNGGGVEYTSAHIDGVDSVLVVHSAHSCQDNPHTIEEVRRILLLHSGSQ